MKKWVMELPGQLKISANTNWQTSFKLQSFSPVSSRTTFMCCAVKASTIHSMALLNETRWSNWSLLCNTCTHIALRCFIHLNCVFCSTMGTLSIAPRYPTQRIHLNISYMFSIYGFWCNISCIAMNNWRVTIPQHSIINWSHIFIRHISWIQNRTPTETTQ